MLGHLPSESVALETAADLPAGGAVVMSCLRPDAGPGAIARYRKLDAVRVDGPTTSS